MSYHKELLMELIVGWNDTQLDTYILELEARVLDTRSVIKELKLIQRKRNRRKKLVHETGARDGR